MANRYNQPAQGTTDWHIPLNENFGNLDDDVEIRDVEANLSNYTPVTDAKFLATDSGKVFIGDGSSWQQLGSVAGGTGLPINHGTLEDALDVTNGSAGTPSDVAAAVEYGLKNYEEFIISNSYTTTKIATSSGVGSVVVRGEGELVADSSISAGDRLLHIQNAARLTIRDLVFNGDFSSHGNRHRMLDLENCEQVALENTLVRNSGDPNGTNGQPHCVNIIGAQSASIRYNRVVDVGGKGINCYANATGDNDPRAVKVVGNTVINSCEEAIFTGDETGGTTAPEQTRYIVADNYCESNTIQNLFRAAGNAVHDLVLRDNEFVEPNDVSAINIKTGGSGGVDPATTHALVAGNKILPNGGTATYGLYVQGTGGGAPGGVFDNNIVYGGVDCTWTSDPQNWQITNNQLFGGGQILVQDGSNYIITENISDVTVQSGVSTPYVVADNIGTVSTP